MTLKSFLKYRFTAKTRHDIHSPFIFEFIETVLRDKFPYPIYQELQAKRKALKKDNTQISITDLGAGSKKPAAVKTVGQIVRTAVQQEKYQQLLFRIIKKYVPKICVELGTSLGLTTNYMHAGLSNDAVLYSLEGDPEILKFAQESVLPKSTSLRLVEGNFDNTLPDIIHEVSAIDLVYIDGNHTYEATLRYFNGLLPKMSQSGIIIFDDIYWSLGMQQAWREITANPNTHYSIDLFQLGIIFMNPVRVKQHFVLKY